MSQEKLADASGYSQTNIGHIEQGKMKRPHIQAPALAEALRTTAEYLLWEKGPKESGPPIMGEDEVRDNYSRLPPEDRAAITALISERLEAIRKNRKSG